MMPDELPLDGIKVVDFGTLIAGPGAAMNLGDLGATVIKVEPEGGETARHIGDSGTGMFHAYNRGKKSLAINLRSELGRAAAERLVREADVVVHNSRPGAMERLGLGPDRVLELNPRCIYMAVSAFGQKRATRSGFDIIAQAESGMMSITGEAGGEPQRTGFTVVDIATSLYGTQAILAALLQRERTGRGTVIATSLIETAVSLQAPMWVQMFRTGTEPTRSGNSQASAAPAAEVYEACDGSVILSAYADAHFRRLVSALGMSEMADDSKFVSNTARIQNRAEMNRRIGSVISTWSAAEVVRRLSEAGVAVGEVRKYRDVPNSPEVQELGLFQEVDSSKAVRLPYQFDGRHFFSANAAPSAGGDNREVLSALGFDDSEINRLVGSIYGRDSGPEDV